MLFTLRQCSHELLDHAAQHVRVTGALDAEREEQQRGYGNK